ncbi:MAG: polysaccharide deacetylase family protein [Candidatus Firestonebacteria bacterium]
MAKLNIPILMYHHVVDKNKVPKDLLDDLYVDISDFEKQMKYISKVNFTSINFDELSLILDKKKDLPKKPIILIFDDGYEDTLNNVLSVLNKYQIKAVVSLVTDFVGKTNIINKEQILNLIKDEISFESHTVTHPHFNNIDVNKLKYELESSKAYLESLLKKQINTIVYPYGEYNEDVKKMAKLSGYKFGCAINSTKKYVLEDLHQIRRVYVKGSDSLFDFKRKISGWYLWFRGVKESKESKESK